MHSYYCVVAIFGVASLLKVLYESTETGIYIRGWEDAFGDTPLLGPALYLKIESEILEFENLRPLYIMQQQYLAIDYHTLGGI